MYHSTTELFTSQYSNMKCYSLVFIVLFLGSAWCCSIVPFVPSYTITQRTILAPLVLHGRVINTTATRGRFQDYEACIQVLEVIKGDKNLPRQMCFGRFGMEELCLTHVFVGTEYIFYMTSERKASYKDGQPKSSAVVANRQTLTMAKQGVCNPLLSSSCQRPRISRGNFQSIVRAQEGETAELACFATGTFPLIITWSKRGGNWDVRFPLTYNKLRIPHVTMSDMGVYQCTVHNKAGETSVLVRLFINPVPCGGFLYLRPGQQYVLQTPNYPQSYTKDKMCSWRICPSPGQRAKLVFKDFDLRRNNLDNLQIFHECEPVRSVMKYCWVNNPGLLISKCTSRCIQVWFHSSPSRLTHSLSKGPYGFSAVASATSEATSLFDYENLYCGNEILIKFIPRNSPRFDTFTGEVVDSYKILRPGQNTTITSDKFFQTGLFGCPIDIDLNKEYYIGAKGTSEPYTMNFAIPVNAPNKPEKFDDHLNAFKIKPTNCPAPPGRVPSPN